jgi:redox-sensitive bicupin YhaK (pirin superfamily)
MSFHDAAQPKCTGKEGPIELLIEPEARDLGDFSVRRVLPSSERKMVGPFIFFDHMGPAEFAPGEGIQVRPHPHIGLATITYLFEGQIMHRDSLGFTQAIHPGAVNLMTAGNGIAHSERAGDDLHEHSRLHGIQSWIALPGGCEDIDPAFAHIPGDSIPQFDVRRVSVRVLMGTAYGHTSPVTTYSPTLYLECRMPVGTALELPESVAEIAAYVVSGRLKIARCSYPAGVMLVACPGKAGRLEAEDDTHLMILGGDPVGARYIWWNFVSSSRKRIEKAKRDWKAGRFETVPGDSEFIPLPD